MCSAEPFPAASDSTYAVSLHVLTAIEIPLHLFGAFIIIAKTPLKMTSVKQSMLLLHTFGALLDIYISSLVIPVITVPFCGGYPLGLLLLLGVRTEIQVYIGFVLVPVVCVSILSFFEDRHYVIGNGVSERRSWKRRAYIIFNYSLSFLYILPAYLAIPNENEGKMAVMQRMPCFPSELLSRPGFFILAIDSTICLVCAGFMMCFLTGQLFFFAISITLKISNSTTKSKSTSKLQKQFIVALGIQVTIPVAIFVFPVASLLMSVWKNYYNQAATNIALTAIGFHGIVSTITMLIVHRPYRNAVLEVLRLNKARRSTSTGSKIWKTVAGGHVSYI